MPDPQKKTEDKITVNFTFTSEEFDYFQECFAVLNDGLEIKQTIEESCLAILLGMKKRRLKKFEGFVFRMRKQLNKIKRMN